MDVRDRQRAGLLLMWAGVLILMGIITGEAVYPFPYTTFLNEISDLGATRPPESVTYQPSGIIFNGTMLVAGALIASAAFFLRRAFHVRRMTISVAILGVSVFLVGVFPGNTGAIHQLVALSTFVASGVSAILSAKVQDGPLRVSSIALGSITLLSLAVAFAGESTFVVETIGEGGLERWVAYPALMWMVAFGAYLSGGWSRREV